MTPHAPASDADPQGLEAALARFILDELAAAPPPRLDPDLPLFESLLDSTSVLALVAHLESAYGLAIAADELVPQHFATLRRLAAFVRRKAAPAPPAARAAGGTD